MVVISNISQEKLKLDLYDKKIIFYLSQNSRMSLNDLAKKLKISIQRCKYKVDRLKKEILSPAMFLTYSLLDIPNYLIFSPDLEDETINDLMKNESIYFMFQSIGAYNYVLNVLSEDISLFCNKYFSDKHIEVLPIINSYADNFNPFNLNIPPKELQRNEKITLDKKDYKILAHLSDHSDDSLLKIQEITNIDRQTIKKRISVFEETNIIQKFRYGINVFKLGTLAYILRIKIPSKSKKNILSAIRSNNYSGFVFETYEGFTMHYLSFTHNDVFEFTKSLTKIDSDILIEVIQNTEFYKVDLVPKIVKNIFEKRSK